MVIKKLPSIVFLLMAILTSSCISDNHTKVNYWLTLHDQTILFEKQNPFLLKTTVEKFDGNKIEINPDETFQAIDGFGYTLTGGSARLLSEMEALERSKILRELFGLEGNGIGVSYLRLSIGASDLSDSVFTYNDLPLGMTDVEMKQFTIASEERYLIPVLREILAINPNVKIMGSPWTPPVWMKTNNSSIGGSLKPEFYDAYALYFVKYIQAMQQSGITIDAITVQNEPLHPGNNPSLLMPAAEQAAFIKQSLGPAFRKNGITTKIVIYDHNADRIDYPLDVLADDDARQYIDGTAFHLYGGKVEDISKVNEVYPNKSLYFTEQWVGHPQDFGGDMAWHVRELIIGATRNWCRTVLEWNLAADAQQKPHTPGGCTRCLGAITIDGNQVHRNVAYYIIAHASKFVHPGSLRIQSTIIQGLPNVAFKTPDGETVLIVLNDTRRTQEFAIQSGDKFATTQLPSGAVATYIF